MRFWRLEVRVRLHSFTSSKERILGRTTIFFGSHGPFSLQVNIGSTVEPSVIHSVPNTYINPLSHRSISPRPIQKEQFMFKMTLTLKQWTTGLNGLKNLKCKEATLPRDIKEGEVLVKINTVSLNYRDIEGEDLSNLKESPQY